MSEDETRPQPAELDVRKKRVRAGHRSSVTRIIGQLKNALESGDTRKLRQIKQSLTEKSSILAALDRDIIEVTGVEQIESEVEQSDLIQEEISLALISIEETLEAITAPTDVPHHQRDTEGTRSLESREVIFPATSHSSRSPSEDYVTSSVTTSLVSAPSVSEAPVIPGATSSMGPAFLPSVTVPERLLPISGASSLTATPPWSGIVFTSAGGLSGTTISSSSPLLGSTLSPSDASLLSSSVAFLPTAVNPSAFVPSSMSSVTSFPSGVAPPMSVPTFPSALPFPTSVPHPVFGCSSHPTSLPLLPPTAADLPGMPHSRPHHTAPQVKLPKLSIKRFNGDMTRWVMFWDTFNSTIHTNPSLSRVDKFNYLVSLLESSAAEAIAGLSITAANYDEAISTLKKRFGNSQLIVNQHMEALLNVGTVSSHHDIKGLRKLNDTVESHVRGLRALGVPTESYGGLLTSVIISKLPPEIKLIVSREMTGETWDLERVMNVFEREVDARERASASNPPCTPRKLQPRIPTATALTTASTGSVNTNITCTYCRQNHPSALCTTVTDVSSRKEILRKAGRCYVCLRKNHLSRECTSNFSCSKCRGKHHASICSRNTSVRGTPTSSTSTRTASAEPSSMPRGTQTTSNLYAGAHAPVLLQTAQLELSNLEAPSLPATVARAILDGGSQRTYITSRIQRQLSLSAVGTESLQIKTFGSSESHNTLCDVVQLGLATKDDGLLQMTALVVPFICHPLTSQPVSLSRQQYSHLEGLDLADSADTCDTLEIDVLIGSDVYWNLVTGRIIRGNSGPTAIHTKVGWVLSGPVDQQDVTVNLSLVSAHTLRIDTYSVETSLDSRLTQFWELESLGIMKNETSVYEKFVQQIKFDGQRYEVKLPWKEHHPPLPDNLNLCHKRLIGLLKRLRQSPQLLSEYNSIVRDQTERGIVEVVSKSTPAISDRTHYLPHHCVVRQDKATSKLRIVYDASARSTGPSLNDCIYTGPKFGQSIFDILTRLRLQRVALTGDIEKAFLMISVDERDRDSLRFLWVSDPGVEPPELMTLRFARVVFGVSSSPFLLNATINHHMEGYRDSDPGFVDKFCSSIYVDDVVSGSTDVESAYRFYLKARLRLGEAGFKLRKFVTNSVELRRLIEKDESTAQEGGAGQHDSTRHTTEETKEPVHVEDDQSYAKTSLGAAVDDKPGTHKVLGARWNVDRDEFCFSIGEVARVMGDLEPTKRNLVSVTAKFFDPLGFVSPVTVLFKVFCQQLCEDKVGWDEPLEGGLLKKWKHLLLMLQKADDIVVPRCVFSDVAQPTSIQLVGFCDASNKAYAAVVYMRLRSETCVDVKFMASKTRVSPIGGTSIPRLELLSALLLSKLMASVQAAIEPETSLCAPLCFTDSKAALYWIRGVKHNWKQFVENRVTTIRSLVEPQCWKHCPGKENPADIPSRGTSASLLATTAIWLDGPDWLYEIDHPGDDGADVPVPDDCQQEMKRNRAAHSLVTAVDGTPRSPSSLIPLEQYSSSQRLFRITALVLKFVHHLRSRASNSVSQPLMSTPFSLEHIDRARLYWVKDSQASLLEDSKFPLWKQQLGLFLDQFGVWRCGGRMHNSCLPSAARAPILLDKRHRLAMLVVMDAHKRVLHNGVKETLSELRSTYWLIRGRQFVRKILHGCVVCRKLEGRPCQGNPPPPLPNYRVQPSRPFQTTGVDFAGPLYVRMPDPVKSSKVWLSLYTCYSTRAIHLDLVPDMTATTFLRSFRRFTSRRGVPARMISDNGKTFKSASSIVAQILKSAEIRSHFTQQHVEWQFNLEKAPWWGGVFERMVKSAKRCLKKVIGRNCLTYDELLTLVTEVEAVLNSRPLSYVSSEDVEEPLTPSHLLVGFRLLTLPDPPVPDDDPEFAGDAQDLTRRMAHLNKCLQGFWKRWKKEYLMELTEFHCTRLKKGLEYTLEKGEVVTVYDKGHPRGMWRLGRIEDLIEGADGRVRGVLVRVASKKGCTKVFRRPVQHIYPLEIRSTTQSDESVQLEPSDPKPTLEQDANTNTAESGTLTDISRRPRRTAAINAREIVRVMMEDSD